MSSLLSNIGQYRRKTYREWIYISGLVTAMPSKNQLVLAATGVYVIAVLLWGYFIIGQILLSVLIALLGIIVYLVWRIL